MLNGGEGKTWFVRNWAKHLDDTNHNVIYLDAFANDYLDDPFLVITSEIANILKKDKSTKNRVNKLIELSASVGTALLPSLPKVALTIGLHLVGAGLLSGVLQQGYENAKDGIDALSDEASERIKESIQEKIAGHEAEKETLKEFKKHLADTVEKLENPLVFIIDELDRCRPDFAIRLIERIKHFFDIPKIVFVLVMDKAQFSKVVCHNYGYDEKLGEEYLDKFVDFTIRLNILPPNLQDSLRENLYSTFEELGFDFNGQKLSQCLDLIEFYIRDRNLSKRSIKKLASQYSLLYSEKFDSYKNQLLIMLLLNPQYLLKSNNNLDFLKNLIQQIDDYISKNPTDFEKYTKQNHMFSKGKSALTIRAEFFYAQEDFSIFIELVDYYEQLINPNEGHSAISVRNLRPTANLDFLGSWKNYIFGGI